MRNVNGMLVTALAVALAATGAHAEQVCNLPPTGNRYVALRTGPGASFPPIVRLRDNRLALEVSEQTGDWVRVSLPDGTTGWLPVDFVCPDGPRR